jgi:DNA-directed RNA polymerase subunit RPC12/RpoP
MRYKCPKCGKLVKDNLFFGLLHFCLSDEDIAKLAECQCDDAPKGHIHIDLQGNFIKPKIPMWELNS